jgi:hypothetical protein
MLKWLYCRNTSRWHQTVGKLGPFKPGIYSINSFRSISVSHFSLRHTMWKEYIILISRDRCQQDLIFLLVECGLVLIVGYTNNYTIIRKKKKGRLLAPNKGKRYLTYFSLLLLLFIYVFGDKKTSLVTYIKVSIINVIIVLIFFKRKLKQWW